MYRIFGNFLVLFAMPFKSQNIENVEIVSCILFCKKLKKSPKKMIDAKKKMLHIFLFSLCRAKKNPGYTVYETTIDIGSSSLERIPIHSI